LRVLEASDVVPDDVEREVRGHITAGASPATETPLTANARTALELASSESTKLGHNYIGCEHVLLGLIAEPKGLAGSVLRQLGLELRITRRAVVTALSGYVHTQRNEPAASRTRLDEILERLDAIEARLSD
jgi:ATP-dependent Clp protease ATP-binding subunit ClpC